MSKTHPCILRTIGRYLLFLFTFFTLFVPGTQPALAAGSAPAYIEPVTDMDFVLVEGGDFLMGDIYGNDPYAKPVHKVSVDDFYLGRHEVTLAQYEAFCAATGREVPDGQDRGAPGRPVVNVTHADARDFTAWLTRKTGRRFRLPSEAEWEYAARAGKSTNFWWGSSLGSGNANCRQCGSRWDGQMPAPVGSFRSNPYGLFDMHGNVYEWVADSWHPDYTGAPVDGSAWVESAAVQFVSRGGSFLEIPASLHVHARNWTANSEARSDIGFRVAMEP